MQDLDSGAFSDRMTQARKPPNGKGHKCSALTTTVGNRESRTRWVACDMRVSLSLFLRRRCVTSAAWRQATPRALPFPKQTTTYWSLSSHHKCKLAEHRTTTRSRRKNAMFVERRVLVARRILVWSLAEPAMRIESARAGNSKSCLHFIAPPPPAAEKTR